MRRSDASTESSPFDLRTSVAALSLESLGFGKWGLGFRGRDEEERPVRVRFPVRDGNGERRCDIAIALFFSLQTERKRLESFAQHHDERIINYTPRCL